jgi:protocatechuate 3,4-dioxygenase beta subunit
LAALAACDLAHAADDKPGPGGRDMESYAEIFNDFPVASPPQSWTVTEEALQRSYYRDGAPFRAKISPPGAPGEPLLLHGRVWGLDTRKPLPHSVIEVWQPDANGRYDLIDGRIPIQKKAFIYRARLITDETGYYEFETVHPGPYLAGPSVWRAGRIHCLVRNPGYRTLATQMFFRGDPHQEADPTFKPTHLVDLKGHQVGAAAFKAGQLNLILERE